MLGFVRKIPYVVLLFCLFTIFGNTSVLASTFKQEWKNATATPPPPNTIVGAWEGVWKSNAHGVSGPLRCVITESGNGHYNATFHAQYHWFHFTYVAKLAAHRSPEALHLTGDADLGWMGGVYHYSGTASPTRYSSTYQSHVENGVLDLKRPEKR